MDSICICSQQNIYGTPLLRTPCTHSSMGSTLGLDVYTKNENGHPEPLTDHTLLSDLLSGNLAQKMHTLLANHPQTRGLCFASIRVDSTNLKAVFTEHGISPGMRPTAQRFSWHQDMGAGDLRTIFCEDRRVAHQIDTHQEICWLAPTLVTHTTLYAYGIYQTLRTYFKQHGTLPRCQKSCPVRQLAVEKIETDFSTLDIRTIRTIAHNDVAWICAQTSPAFKVMWQAEQAKYHFSQQWDGGRLLQFWDGGETIHCVQPKPEMYRHQSIYAGDFYNHKWQPGD